MLEMRTHTIATSVALALVVAATTGRAESPDTLRHAPAIGDTVLADMVAFGTDAVMLFGAPSRFDALDWGVAGGAVAVGFGAMALDDEAREIALRNQGSDGDRIADVANSFGTWTPPIVISGSLYLAGLAFDEPSVRLAGRHVAQAVLYAGLVTTTAKVIIGRQRPLYNEGPFVFDAFTADDRYHALASGHTTLAFTMASSLSADIDHPAATVALYGLASLTGLARLYVDRHWASDALLGAAVGIACGYGVANLHDESDGEASLLLVPGVERLSLVWVF